MNIFLRILVAITQFGTALMATCLVLIPFESWHGASISNFNAILLTFALTLFASAGYAYAVLAQFIYDDTI